MLPVARDRLRHLLDVEIVAEDAQEWAIGVGVDVAARSVDSQLGDPGHTIIVTQINQYRMKRF